MNSSKISSESIARVMSSDQIYTAWLNMSYQAFWKEIKRERRKDINGKKQCLKN
jgi:hypothetical protein